MLPDSTILAFYMLRITRRVLDGLYVDKSRMLANLSSGGGIVYSGRVLSALIEAGMDRDDAYAVVQSAATGAWEGEGGFREMLGQKEEVVQHLGADLGQLFDPSYALRNLGVVFDRVQELEGRLDHG